MKVARRPALSAFLRGVGSVLDLGGTLGPKREDLTLGGSAEEQDRRALAADWQTVADDLRVAAERLAKEP